jgi:hypothetical protein
MARHSLSTAQHIPIPTPRESIATEANPGALAKHAQGIDHVLPDLGEIRAAQPNGDVGEQPHESGQTVPPPGFRSGIFAQPFEILTVHTRNSRGYALARRR